MKHDARIYVAGHRGLVGSAIVRALQAKGFGNLLLRTRAELDLRDSTAVHAFFAAERPAFVFMAAAKVGGIHANDTYPADFISENLTIAVNTISAAHHARVNRFLFLSSSCVYPRNAPQPMREEYILGGPLESTNEPYAIAKIAGMKMCDAYQRQFGDRFFSVLPTNAYGPHDNFDLQTSHVLPALVRKFIEARTMDSPTVTLWGTGQARREFIYSDDLADACVFLMQHHAGVGQVNVGVGEDLTIAELAGKVARVVGYDGRITYDVSKPDGTPRKLLDISRLAQMGWRPRISLEDGIARTVEWYSTAAGTSHATYH